METRRAATLFLVYIIAGMCYNYLVLGLRGLDLVPRYSVFSIRGTVQFLRSCVERVKEHSESLHFGSSGMGSWRSRPNGTGYRGLAQSREEEAGMLGGPTGYLDDEDEDEGHGSDSRPTGMDSNGVIRL